MKPEIFFKPTPLYKEYMILDLIEKDSHTTQRKISSAIDTAVSLVNEYLEHFEQKGYIRRKYQSTKMIEYIITTAGIERKKVLNIGFLKSSQRIYNYAKENITDFLEQIASKGFKKILLYGSGEVAEIILNVISSNRLFKLDVIAIIDDDSTKVGAQLENLPVISRRNIELYDHDGILISSYKHHEKIKSNLQEIGYPASGIIEFFE